MSLSVEHELPSLIVAPEAHIPGGNDILPNLRNLPTLHTIPPTPAVPSIDAINSLQDIDSDDYTEEDASSTNSDFQDLIDQANQLWTDEAVSVLMSDLKEVGMVAFIKKYIGEQGMSIRQLLMPFGVLLPPEDPMEPTEISEMGMLRILKVVIGRVLRRREKLPSINTIEDVIHLISTSKRILVLSGAGVSTSCGIPDFRSANGIYATLEQSRPELYDPQMMFDINVFKEDPSIFYSFAKELYPSNFKPSPSHRFIKLLEEKGKLLRNYTQNIDTLEHLAGVKNVLNCHGSFAQAACIVCGYRVPGDFIKDDIFAGQIPLCPKCISSDAYLQQQIHRKQRKSRAKKPRFSQDWDDNDESEDEDDNPWKDQPIMKPTITFFGEKLSDEFDNSLLSDRDQVDLLLVMGTSLKVAPVSEIIGHLPHSIPQILINRDPITHCSFDVALLGDSDRIVEYLCSRLEQFEAGPPWPLSQSDSNLQCPQRVGSSHIYLFPGANSNNKFVQQFDLMARRPRSSSREPMGGLSLPKRSVSKGRSSRASSRSGSPPSEAESSISVASRTRDRMPGKRTFDTISR